MTAPKSGSRRGGRRAGAGAPKGNKNAATHLRRSRSVMLRAFWDTLDKQQQRVFRPVLRELAAVLPGFEDLLEEDAPGGRVIDLVRPPVAEAASPKSHQYTHTHRDRQSDNQRERVAQRRVRIENVTERLAKMGMFLAEDWVRVHQRVLSKIEQLLMQTAQLGALYPDRWAGLDNPIGVFITTFHDAIGVRIGRKKQCPYCLATQGCLVEPDPALEDKDADIELGMEDVGS